MKSPKVKVTLKERKDFPMESMKMDEFYKDLLDCKKTVYGKQRKK